MHVLRRKSDVSHDRKSSRCESSNGIRHGAAAFQFHSGSVAFLEKSRRIPHSLLCRHDVIVKDFWYTDAVLHLIPSRLELARLLRHPMGRERRLAKALAKVANDYDLIIIDCAPTESVLTDVAYFASRYVVVPVKPEFLAAIGLPLLARSLEVFRKENDDHLIDVAGIVFNHGDYQPGPESKQSVKEVRDLAAQESWHIFENEIPHSKAVPKSARESSIITWTSHARTGIKGAVRDFCSELYGIVGL